MTTTEKAVQIAYGFGWLEAFELALWTMADPESAPEAAKRYGEELRKLKHAVCSGDAEEA